MNSGLLLHVSSWWNRALIGQKNRICRWLARIDFRKYTFWDLSKRNEGKSLAFWLSWFKLNHFTQFLSSCLRKHKSIFFSGITFISDDVVWGSKFLLASIWWVSNTFLNVINYGDFILNINNMKPFFMYQWKYQ